GQVHEFYIQIFGNGPPLVSDTYQFTYQGAPLPSPFQFSTVTEGEITSPVLVYDFTYDNSPNFMKLVIDGNELDAVYEPVDGGADEAMEEFSVNLDLREPLLDSYLDGD